MPVPNFASKRRYEATPSAIIMPRPLAPHTDAAVPEVDEGRLGPKTKPIGSSQQVPLHTRPTQDKERNISRYPPLAQASAVPVPILGGDDASRAMRPQATLPPRLQGPRLGYFADDRREIPGTVLSHPPASHAQELTVSSRQTPVSAAEMARLDPLHAQGYRNSNVDIHGSPLLPVQAAIPASQPAYMPPQHPSSLMPTGSHSRQPSLTKTPSSPAQPLLVHEPEHSPIRRDSISQRPFFTLPGQPASIAQPPMLSPPKELLRPGSTPLEPPEPPRVPAKRSNIMSILNDEPEEPQPRKRFASDQVSTPASNTGSPSRAGYAGMQSLSQPPSRPEDPSLSAQPKGPVYNAPSPYLPPSRGYVDRGYAEYHQPYGSVSGGAAPATNDWMARFDPRGQQPPPPPQQQPQPQPQPSSRTSASLASQPAYSPYTSHQSLPGPSLQNLTAPSPAPTPSPATAQRPAYHGSVYVPSPASHAQASAAASREIAAQNAMYRPAVGSPTPRNGSLASYGSRQGPPTPIQSPANLLGMPSRQPTVAQPAYVSAPATPGGGMSAQQHANHQTYQQHVQTMVNGAHQQAAHRSALGLAGAVAYGHSTPPPQAQMSRAAGLPGPGPQGMAMGRSYTPPAILQPNPAGGLSYAPSGAVHAMQARPPGPGGLEPGTHGAPGHHRVYSQGSNPGPLPGQMTPQHAPR